MSQAISPAEARFTADPSINRELAQFRMRLEPSTNGYTSNAALAPSGVIPNRTAVPARGSAVMASSTVSGRPIASNT